MSQSSQVLTAGVGGDTWASAYPKINSNFDAIWTWFSGASAPASPPTYLRWIDTAGATRPLKTNTGTPASPTWVTILDDILVAGGGSLRRSGGTMTGNIDLNSVAKVVNSPNASANGDVVPKSQVDGKILVASAKITGFNATLNRPLFIAPANCTIHKVWILSDTATTGSSGGTNWQFQVRNVGTAGAGTTDMLSTAKSTNGAEIGAYDSYDLGANQNLSMADGEGLQLRITKTGAPTDLSAAEIQIAVQYKVAV